jgi:hypothetical protein
MVTNFIIVSGIVAIIGATVKIFEDKGNTGGKKATT